MNLRHQEYNARFIDHARDGEAALNYASQYGAEIARADVGPDVPYWRVIGVHHLSPDENRGDHHVYIDVLDEQGQRIKNDNLALHWTWEGRTADQVAKPAKLEKPHSEPVANVPINRGTVIDVWLAGDGTPSERVRGLHANHDDEPGPGDHKWNTKGHHSFYIVFQRTRHQNDSRNDATDSATNGIGAKQGPTGDVVGGETTTPTNGGIDSQVNGQPGGNQPAKPKPPAPQPEPTPDNRLADLFPEYIFGIHEHTGGGDQTMLQAGRKGWVLELASVGLDGGSDNADFRGLANQGLSVVVRIHNGYEPAGALPKPQHYDQFAQACATFVSRSRGCHIWVIGNEPNHKAERPEGEFIFPDQYGTAYTRCRRAIRQVRGHEQDLVLIAGPAPWNAETRYAGNEGGDWVKYFTDQIDAVPLGECDGFAIHTYTHTHDPATIRGDYFQGADGYKHLRNEFRTYQDFMNAIPARCRHLPVLITETDPTTPGQGWGAGHNNGWVREAYREIADWNSEPGNQPIQGMMLYRWPDHIHHGQKEWSIANRPGVVEDFNAALRAEPASDFRVRLPRRTNIDPRSRPAQQTIGRIPNIFTNQQLINACFGAAEGLGTSGDDLMSKAGLDVHQLAATPEVREMRYNGQLVADLPHWDDTVRNLVELNLIKELRNVRRWQGQIQAQGGLNLRADANGSAEVLMILPDQVMLDVLDDQNEWLCVAADVAAAGFVHRDFVKNVAAATRSYFRNEPSLRSIPMAPVEAEQIPLSPNAKGGETRLVAIWNRYGGLSTAIAKRLGIDPSVTIAVLNVESGGLAFGSPGKPVIRFENHLFYADWGQHQPELFSRHFTFNPATQWEDHAWRSDPNRAFQTIHAGQTLEWRVLDFAANLPNADTAAKRSISMGAPQILGRNHQKIGYATVQEMFNAFSADERNHVLGFFDFVQDDARLVQALRNKDYLPFAEGYNGEGRAEEYARLIKANVAAFHQLTEVSFGLGDGALLDDKLDSEISFIPMPRLPDALTNVGVVDSDPTTDERAGKIGISVDDVVDQPSALPLPTTRRAIVEPEVRAAWIKYVKQGLENNNTLFRRILRAFIVPYYLTVAMYVLLFLIGISLFAMAAVLSLRDGKEIFGLIFAGLGIATFIGYFLSRPLRALEENLQLITWLGIAYNTYWTRLLYMNDQDTVHTDLKDANAEASAEIQRIIDKSKELSGKRPGDDVGRSQ